MYRYKLYDLIIESEIFFRQLIIFEDDTKPVDIRIYKGEIKQEVEKHAEKRGLSTTKFLFGHEITYFSCVDGYIFIKDGTEIIFEAAGEKGDERISQWIFGCGISFLLLQRNIPAIHCSALSNGEDAILIAGGSGSGKSTITRKLLEKGYRFLADDITPLTLEGENLYAHPAYPYQKLCRNEIVERNLNPSDYIRIDAERDKYLIPCDESFENKKKPVKAMIWLNKGYIEEVLVRKLFGIEQLMAFKHNIFVGYLVEDKLVDPGFLKMCLNYSAKLPIYMLVRPEGKNTINEITDIVEKIYEENKSPYSK